MDIRVFNNRISEKSRNYAPFFEIRSLKTRISMNNSRESEGFVENKIGGAPALTVSF